MSKTVRIYERDGTVRRRVTRDLGNGIRTTTSDVLMHTDVKEFAKQNPNVRVRGYHPQVQADIPSPHRHTLDELPTYLASIDSVDVLLRLRRLDDRKMAAPMYEERLDEILSAELGEDDDA